MTRVLFAVALCGMAVVRAGGAQSAPPAEQTRTLNLSAYAELLRSDIKVQKVAIFTTVLGFSESVDKALLPFYREYDAQMAKLGDERVALIAEYSRGYDKINDEAADALAVKALDLERRRQEAKACCYARVKAALNGRSALRFLQVEHQLQQLIDLQISSALPIAPR
jgi:hypothetical protein